MELKGAGNVTNIQIWNDAFKFPGIFYGIGQGIITSTDGQMATGMDMILDDLTTTE